MSQFDSTLRLFEAMDGLDDAFIEEGMLPDASVSSPLRGRRAAKERQNPLLRFMRSGWGVAVLCAVVSLTVLTAVVRLGIRPPASGDSIPPGNQNPDGFVSDTLPYEEESVTLPPEEERVPAGTVSVDDTGLRYTSYGNGTCICMGGGEGNNATELHIPDYSPDGDVVVAIYAYAFRDALGLTSVTLPAGLRSYDLNTFPMEASIYTLRGNVLYLGSDGNPYLVAVATSDGRPGATSLHPATRVLASYALTYETGAYFALAWKEKTPAYTDDEVFSLPSSLIAIGEYALLDVGRDVTYNGYLVGWDVLTASPRTGLIRRPDGQSVTVRCLDGETTPPTAAPHEIKLDATASAADGILYGGYFSYAKRINEDYYDWLRRPADFAEAPDQFVTASATQVLGGTSRVLTSAELASMRFSLSGTDDPALAEFAETFNEDLGALYTGKRAVLLCLREDALYRHVVTSVTAVDGDICVTVARVGDAVGTSAGERFILLSVQDPDGRLAGADVICTVTDSP